MTLQYVLDTTLQAVLTIVLALIPVTVPIVLKKLFDKWGATADQSRREAVSTAIVNGLTHALDKRGLRQGSPMTSTMRQAVSQEAAAYARSTVPETIEKLRITDINLPKIAMARMPEAIRSLQPTTAGEESRPGPGVPPAG